jgi:hypothetical protein
MGQDYKGAVLEVYCGASERRLSPAAMVRKVPRVINASGAFFALETQKRHNLSPFYEIYCLTAIHGMIYLNCTGEIIMPSLFVRVERNVRLIMGGLALLTLVVLLLFKAQLIQFQPSFDAYGWYTVSAADHGIAYTLKADNEASCRARSLLTAATCLQGKSLNTDLVAQSRLP